MSKNQNQKKDNTNVTCSIPEGFEYNKAYSLDELVSKSKYYWETNRNTNEDDTNTINPNFSWHLDKVVEKISNLLKEKNEAYGNSALKPLNIFSKLDATESLCSRIDDKLARIANRGINDHTEDTVDDLIGYLLLLKMAIEKEKGIF